MARDKAAWQDAETYAASRGFRFPDSAGPTCLAAEREIADGTAVGRLLVTE